MTKKAPTSVTNPAPTLAISSIVPNYGNVGEYYFLKFL
jgi:hypothetical protein